MFTVLVAVMMLTLAGPTDPQKGKLEPPKYADTYGEKRTKEIYRTCMETGLRLGYTGKSVSDVCTCKIFILQDVVPAAELDAMSAEERANLFFEIDKGCRSIGISPIPVVPDKSKIKPDDESVSI